MRSMFVTTLLLWGTLGYGAHSGGRLPAFELGKRHYESGDYNRALDLFSQAIGSAHDPARRNLAYYYQGLTLFEMGYFYSAYVSFRNVLVTVDDRNKEIYEKSIKNSVIIADRLDMIDRIGKVLDRLPGNLVAAKVASYAHYATGVYRLMAGDNREASSHLKSVSPDSQFYPKALFFLGIVATREKNYHDAEVYYRKVLDLVRGKRDLFPLSELARLDLARTVYSAGDIERSIEIYAQFLSSSPHWLEVLLEASWPLMRVNDTTISLGNLQTVLSPFYREDLVGEGYILRATILYSLCKYEEMRQTLAQFFTIYDPVLRAMQTETAHIGGPDAYYQAFVSEKGLNRAFVNFAKRDQGITKALKVQQLLRDERHNIAKFSRNEQMRRMAQIIDETDRSISIEIGSTLQKLHRAKLAELVQQREQANYLKVEIVTGEKELIEGQKGLPPKRIVDVETTVAPGYNYWPFRGEYWEDELGTYVYTTESSCVQ